LRDQSNAARYGKAEILRKGMEMVLSHSYRIVVPTTIYNTVAPADVVDEIRDRIKKNLSAAFGGYTEIKGSGGYVAESGELIEEDVWLIEVSCFEPNDELIRQIAGWIKTELEQESVMIQKDNEVHFL
jgi:hypothetical protein